MSPPFSVIDGRAAPIMKRSVMNIAMFCEKANTTPPTSINAMAHISIFLRPYLQCKTHN